MTIQTVKKFKTGCCIQRHDVKITTRTMKLAIVCASVYILFYNLISHGVYERLKNTKSVSTLRNFCFNCETDSYNENPTENGSVVRSSSELTENTSTKNEYEIKTHFMKVKNQRIYIYSAIVHHNDLAEYSTMSLEGDKKNHEPADFIALNGWRHKSSDKNLKCCYLHEDFEKISSAKMLGRIAHFSDASLRDVHYRCPPTSKVVGIGLTSANSLCPTQQNHYISPVVIKKKKNLKIGVCTKLSYGTIEEGPLVEWFEAMRFIGVDKIISYNSNLSPKTKKVFDYYSSIGLVDCYPFELPEKEKYPRELGEKSKQAWTDEQVVINDCRMRLSAFKYSVFLDKDEILLPKKLSIKNSLRTYFEMLPDDIVGQSYMSEIHLTDWKPSNPTHPLFIGRYTVRSEPVKNSMKYMFKPQYFKTAGCFAHKCSMLNGTRTIIANDSEIAVHHFRSCDTERLLFANGTFCRETARSPSKKIAILADSLTKIVSDTLKLIGVSK